MSQEHAYSAKTLDSIQDAMQKQQYLDSSVKLLNDAAFQNNQLTLFKDVEKSTGSVHVIKPIQVNNIVKASFTLTHTQGNLKYADARISLRKELDVSAHKPFWNAHLIDGSLQREYLHWARQGFEFPISVTFYWLPMSILEPSSEYQLIIIKINDNAQSLLVKCDPQQLFYLTLEGGSNYDHHGEIRIDSFEVEFHKTPDVVLPTIMSIPLVCPRPNCTASYTLANNPDGCCIGHEPYSYLWFNCDCRSDFAASDNMKEWRCCGKPYNHQGCYSGKHGLAKMN